MKLFLKTKDMFDGGKRKDLIHHVKRGDLDYIKKIDPSLLLKTRDEDGNTVLLIATINGYLNLCKEIAKQWPSLVYHQNKKKETVLHQLTTYPTGKGNYRIIDFFVSFSLDQDMTIARWLMNMKNSEGHTALWLAIYNGNIHVVKRLVEVERLYKLGISMWDDSEGKTALQWAIENQDLELVKLLTDEGDPYSNYIPFSIVEDLFDRVREGDLNYIKTIELNVLLNSRGQDRMSVLCIATECHQLDCCKQILKRCPSLLYHQNHHKKTLLHHAVWGNDNRLIDFFVSAGLDAAKSEGEPEGMEHFQRWINLQNSGGSSALMLALDCNNYSIVKRFIEVDRQYKLGLWNKIVGIYKNKALQLALNEDHEMIKTLTGREDTNPQGNIPISMATQQDQESLQAGNSSSTEVASESNEVFTLAEVSKHNNSKDCWLVINDKVYDVTNFLEDHPGGGDVLLKATGKDATNAFQEVHSHSNNAITLMDKLCVGMCDSITSSLHKLASDKPQPYSRVQLKDFTKDFSQPLGSGGFGDVYKGQFSDGVFIAVKVLKNIHGKEKIMEEQFVAEVDTMGRAYHRNLIKLYGYCYEPNTKFKALVYDYMENGSFDMILFEKKVDIPWPKLHNIAKEIAQGISYLHENCYPQIIHQDIKPANVLLDSNLSPRVIDFGLAKVNMGESQFEQTKIKGSRDYMAPEVNQPDKVKLSCKCDVYSFGKMLFDILGSKRNHVDKTGFPGQVWEKFKTNELDKFILDCGIKEEDKENAKRLAIIALLCVEHNPLARPMLSNVVKMLEGKIKHLDTPATPFYPDYYSSESSSMSDSRDY